MPSKEELQKELKFYINQYRIAVRWLRDVRLYKATYGQETTYEGKSWKGDNELAEDSTRAYDEAVSTLLHWRRKVDSCNERLIDLAGERNARRN